MVPRFGPDPSVNTPWSHPAFHQAQREGIACSSQWGSTKIGSGTGLGCYFSPFGLAAWFRGDPFPLHQLLHCIGVDYWSDWVAFVSPRVFLFHCLFPPETSGKEKKRKPHQWSLSPPAAPAGQELAPQGMRCVPDSQPWLGATQPALLGKDTATPKLLLQAAGTTALAHSPEAALPFPSHMGQRMPAPNVKVPFSQSVTTDSGLQEFTPKGSLPAGQQFPSLCSLSGDTKSTRATVQFRNESLFLLCCVQTAACTTPFPHTYLMSSFSRTSSCSMIALSSMYRLLARSSFLS